MKRRFFDREETDGQQRRRREKREERRAERRYVRATKVDDFITLFLVRWTLRELVKYTKLLLIILNRTEPTHSLASARRMSHASEYAESHFADTTAIEYDDETQEVEEDMVREVSFRRYFNLMYSSAKNYLRDVTPARDAEAESLQRILRACFLIGFVHDARIRRFVLTKHDTHYLYMRSLPTSARRAQLFLAPATFYVDSFLDGSMSIEEMTSRAIHFWTEECMFMR